MKENICVDLTDVLFINGQHHIKNLEERKKLKPETLRNLINSETANRYRIGEISEQEFERFLSENFPENVSLEEFREVRDEPYMINRGLVTILEGLKNNDHFLALTSGAAADRVSQFKSQYDFDYLFDTQIHSHNIGYDKSKPKYWKIFKDSIPKNVSGSILIDDRIDYVNAAKSFDFKTIIYTDNETLINSLNLLGIQI